MRIVNNRICYPTHNILLDHNVDPFAAAEIVENCNTATKQSRALQDANIVHTIERPIVKMQPHYQSERQERHPEMFLPTQVLFTVTQHNGNYEKVIAVYTCNRNEIREVWKRLYQQGIKCGARYRRFVERQFNVAYNEAYAAFQAAQYVDPATQI
jgi:hypothetical protein